MHLSTLFLKDMWTARVWNAGLFLHHFRALLRWLYNTFLLHHLWQNLVRIAVLQVSLALFWCYIEIKCKDFVCMRVAWNSKWFLWQGWKEKGWGVSIAIVPCWQIAKLVSKGPGFSHNSTAGGHRKTIVKVVVSLTWIWFYYPRFLPFPS